MPEFSRFDCVVHPSLATLVRNRSLLTEPEARYALNPLTHVDFLLFGKLDKAPVLVIEVDGTGYHAQGSRQAERDAIKNNILKKCEIPILRIRTDESEVDTKIICALQKII